MDVFGISMNGSLVVEKVSSLPIWAKTDIGRIIFCNDSSSYFLGTYSSTLDEDGWTLLGVSKGTIKNYHIDWDDEFTGGYGKVNASYIPSKFGDTTCSAQVIFDYIYNKFTEFGNGSLLLPHTICDYHLKLDGLNAIRSSTIPVDNLQSFFNGENVTVEDALNQLAGEDASVIPMEPNGNFGQYISFNKASIQVALESMEEWIFNINASNLNCTYPGCDNCKTTIQDAIDKLYNYHYDIKLTDLVDVPSYVANKFFLKSNGNSCVEWTALWSNDISCFYPGNSKNNLQTALHLICEDLTDLCKFFGHRHPSHEIDYVPNIYDIKTAEQAFNWLFNYCWTQKSCQPANMTPCSPIGAYKNVDNALKYLYNEVLKLQSLIPCSHLPISSNPLSSDIKLKENIIPINNALDIVLNLNGVTFDWKDNRNDCKLGLIAQDVEKVLPLAVTNIDESTKGIYYDRIVPVLIEAIKQQQNIIDDLTNKINKLL